MAHGSPKKKRLFVRKFHGTQFVWGLPLKPGLDLTELHPVFGLLTRVLFHEKFVQISDHKIASCSLDKAIKICDFIKGERERTFDEHHSSVQSLIKLPNNNIASCSTDNTIRIWNLESGNCIKVIKNQCSSGIFSMYLLPENRLVYNTSATFECL